MIEAIKENGLQKSDFLHDMHDNPLISLICGRRFKIWQAFFLKVIMKNLIKLLLVVKKMVERFIKYFSILHQINQYNIFLQVKSTNDQFDVENVRRY